MTLNQLAKGVSDAIASANECGVSPDEIAVSLQIDGPQTESVWATDIELHYDNDGQASGCVLLGWRLNFPAGKPPREMMQILGRAAHYLSLGYEKLEK